MWVSPLDHRDTRLHGLPSTFAMEDMCGWVQVCVLVYLHVQPMHPAENRLGCNSSSYGSTIINLHWLKSERSGPVSMTPGWIRSRGGPFSHIDQPSLLSSLAVHEITTFPSRQNRWYITHVELFVIMAPFDKTWAMILILKLVNNLVKMYCTKVITITLNVSLHYILHFKHANRCSHNKFCGLFT